MGCGKIAMKACSNISCKPCCGKKGYCVAHMAGQFAREDRLAAKKSDAYRLDIEDGVSDDDDDKEDEDYILALDDKEDSHYPFKHCNNFHDAHTEHDDIIDMREGYGSIFDKEREEEKEAEEEKTKAKKKEKGKEKVAEPEEVCSPERVRRTSRETRQKQAHDSRSRNVGREKNPRDEELQEREEEEEEEESDLLIYSSAEVR